MKKSRSARLVRAEPELFLPTALERELRALLNRMSQENQSNTPDFVLAEYLARCLDAFNVAVVCRDKWYGVRLRPGVTVPGD